jgi:predicted porin
LVDFSHSTDSDRLTRDVSTRPNEAALHAGRTRHATPITLTVAALTGLTSLAQAQEIDAELEVYGHLVPQPELIRTTGATAPGEGSGANQVPDAGYSGVDQPWRSRLTQGTSNFGLRGRISLLENLSLFMQIENGVPIDGDLLANTIAQRNSAVGLTGVFGTLLVGQWDSPYKWATLPVNNPVKAGILPDYTAILGSPGFLVSALNLLPSFVPNAAPGALSANAAFYRRDADVVQYWSPQLAGFSLRLGYVMDESTRPAGPDAPAIRPQIFSGMLAYDTGELKLRYAGELHNDYFGMSLLGGSPSATATNPSSTDMGHIGVASYRFVWSEAVTMRVVGNFEYLSYSNDDQTAGAVEEYSRMAFFGLIDQSFGKHHVWGSYAQALDGDCSVVGGGACSTAGLGAKALTLGYLYRATPVTDFYVAAYTIINDTAASYTSFPPLPPVPAPGADVQSLSVAVVYHFSGKMTTK